MNVMMNDALIIMMKMNWMKSNYERDDKLLRPLNTSDGRDVMELEERRCDECDVELCDDDDDNEMNDVL